nr:RNA-directed DNA polymerase, eukaryota [Tanacetum cinerariifolium]
VVEVVGVYESGGERQRSGGSGAVTVGGKIALGDFLVTSARRLIDDYLLPKGDVQTRWVININKSKLMGYGVHSDKVETATRYIGCATFVAPFSHLGVKVGGRMERIYSWDDVVSKVISRLSKWKLKTLSIGCWLTLIKSVLTSIPLYQMCSFKVPIKVLNILESIRRKFFNGIEGNERKLTLISWDRVLASKKYGGLGVSSFFAMNHALLSKWVWPFYPKHHLCGLEPLKLYMARKEILEPMVTLLDTLLGLILFEISISFIPKSLEASGDFLVTSARCLIDDYLLPKEDVQTRWVKVVSIKINVFTWRVCLDKLPTRLNLSLRGVEISFKPPLQLFSGTRFTPFLYVSCGVSYLEESLAMVGSR